MVAGWLGLELQPPSAAPRVTGRPFSGSTPPTLNWEGSRKGDPNKCLFHSHGQVAEPRRGNPYLGPNNTKKLIIGTWNVRTLLDLDNNSRPKRRTALIAYELKKYNIDIAALNETRFSDEGSLTESGEGYTFWKGLDRGAPRIHGVAFAIKTRLLNSIPQSPTGHNERLITWRIPLSNKRHATLVNVYAPTLDSADELKDQFYAQLHEIMLTIPKEDKIILLGDFNARVGSSHHLWERVLGHHGVGKCNDNGLRLLTFCSQHNLSITNTIFQLQNKFKTTWMHPRSRIWHLLDYVIVRRNDMKDVRITRAMRGADGWTDHRLVRSIFLLKIRPPARRQAPRKHLDLKALNNITTRAALQNELAECLTLPTPAADPITTAFLTEKWESICEVLLNTAKDILGFSRRKHRDWFDEQSDGIHQLIEEKKSATASSDCKSNSSITCQASRASVKSPTGNPKNAK